MRLALGAALAMAASALAAPAAADTLIDNVDGLTLTGGFNYTNDKKQVATANTSTDVFSNIDLVQTAPNVTYEILTTAGETLRIYNPQKVPDSGARRQRARENDPIRELRSAPARRPAIAGKRFGAIRGSCP